jgi:hypothetical protein
MLQNAHTCASAIADSLICYRVTAKSEVKIAGGIQIPSGCFPAQMRGEYTAKLFKINTRQTITDVGNMGTEIALVPGLRIV